MWQNSTSRRIAQASTPKDARQQLQGAISRAQGEHFEQLIEAGCTYYRENGIADIEKTPEPMKPIRDLGGGKFVAVYTKAAQADFKGTLAGGRAINFEAKHTDTGRMEQSRVTEEQTKKLNNTARMGGVCFVLCSFGGQFFCRIPWAVWRDMKAHFGHKYITPEEAAPYRVRYGGPGTLLFLENMEVKPA